MVRSTFFWPYSMFSSVLPLVQMAQVTLGHPKDVNKEERKKSTWQSKDCVVNSFTIFAADIRLRLSVKPQQAKKRWSTCPRHNPH